MLTLPIQYTTLPAGVCNIIASEQDRLAVYAAHLFASFPSSISGIVASTTKPTDTTAVWLKLDTNLRPVRIYYYASGKWISRHPQEPGTIIMWDGALPDFNSFDGGDTGALTLISGPMWEEVTALQAKIPIGAGTLPSSTVLNVTDTGGEETHTLTIPEMPEHSHTTDWAAYNGQHQNGPQPAGIYPVVTGFGNTDTGLTGGGSAHNNLPPYYTVYFLRRTAKQFYAEP